MLPDEDRFLADHDLIATVSGLEEVQRFEAIGETVGRILTVHLKIDTGMGRLGVWHEVAAPLCAAIMSAPHLRLGGVCTHFASSDDDPAFTEEQRRRFLAALQTCAGLKLNEVYVHADNSAGLETLADSSAVNAVRVGLLQFGISSRPGSTLAPVHIEPVFSFHTRVGLVKALPRGATVSYGRTHLLTRETVIAVLCAGYADGIPRAASNRARVLIRGQRCPVLGGITMDQTIVDVTDLSGVATNDEAVLIGRQNQSEISAREFSEWGETIPWEALCSISKRVARVYKTTLGL